MKDIMPEVEEHADAPEIKKPVNVSNNSQLVPLGMRVASEWSWRLIVIGAAIAIGVYILGELSIVVIPLMVALLLTALLTAPVNKLVSWKFPRVVAVLVSLLGLVGVVSALVALVGNQFTEGYPELRDKAIEGFNEVRAWASDMLLHQMHVSTDDLNKYVDQGIEQVKGSSGAIASGTFAFGSTLGHIVAGFVLSIFILIFFLLDGAKIWKWLVGLLPYNARADANEAGQAGWKTVVAYVRVQMFVAFVDGLGVAVVAAILHIPLAIPLGVLVFLGSFVPIVGSLVSGLVAVLVALVAQGPMTALFMLIGVIAVQQFESHVLQPFVIGSSLSLHPLAVVLVVAAGTYLAGIPGALFSVPIAAATNVMAKTVASHYRDPENPEAFVKAESEPNAALDNLFSGVTTKLSSLLSSSSNGAKPKGAQGQAKQAPKQDNPPTPGKE